MNNSVATPPSGELANPTLHALQRLAMSRQQLRMALIPPPAPPTSGSGAWSLLPRGMRQQWRRWRQSMHGWPLLDLAGEALQRWWRAQPWRPVGEALGGEASTWLRQAVRRHPLASAAAAAAAGALLVRARAWRWALLRRPVQSVPLLAGRWLRGQLAQPALMAMLTGLVLQSVQRPKPDSQASVPAVDDDLAPAAAQSEDLRWFYGGTPPPEPPAAEHTSDRVR